MAKIRMYSGDLVDPFNLKEEDIIPEVFIHQLALLNRFHGATKYPYSVLQHSLNLYYLVPKHLQPAALVHDFEEALFNDLASPVKYECPTYVQHITAAGKVIQQKFGLTPEIMQELKEYDSRIYKNERDALFNRVAGEGMGDDRPPLPVPPGLQGLFLEADWRAVKQQFLEEFYFCFPEYYGVGR